MIRRISLGLALGLAPSAATAHAFAAGADSYAALIEGAGVIVTYPGLFLPLLALAVMVALWRPDGLLAAWPALLLGLLIGIYTASLAGPWAAYLAMGSGLIVALLSALLGAVRPRLLAFVVGLCVMTSALEGHGFLELPVSIQLGLFLAANAVVAAPAAWAQLLMEQAPEQVGPIVLRIAASWIAAILLLLIAFELRPLFT